MTYPNYPLMNSAEGYNLSAGMQVPFQYIQNVSQGWFMPLFLLLAWLGVSIAGYSFRLRRGQDSNFFSTLSVVGLGMLLFMLVLSAIPNLISVNYLIIGLVLELICVFIFFLTERNPY